MNAAVDRVTTCLMSKNLFSYLLVDTFVLAVSALRMYVYVDVITGLPFCLFVCRHMVVYIATHFLFFG